MADQVSACSSFYLRGSPREYEGRSIIVRYEKLLGCIRRSIIHQCGGMKIQTILSLFSSLSLNGSSISLILVHLLILFSFPSSKPSSYNAPLLSSHHLSPSIFKHVRPLTSDTEVPPIASPSGLDTSVNTIKQTRLGLLFLLQSKPSKLLFTKSPSKWCSIPVIRHQSVVYYNPTPQ